MRSEKAPILHMNMILNLSFNSLIYIGYSSVLFIREASAVDWIVSAAYPLGHPTQLGHKSEKLRNQCCLAVRIQFRLSST